MFRNLPCRAGAVRVQIIAILIKYRDDPKPLL